MSEHISKFRPGQDVTFDASAAVTGGQVVALTGDRSVGPAGAASAAWIGVAAFDAAVGQKVTVKSGGVEELTASGAIAAGASLVTAAAGQAATGAAATPAAFLGVALAAAANGRVLVKLAR